jgi:hypothetical protein
VRNLVHRASPVVHRRLRRFRQRPSALRFVHDGMPNGRNLQHDGLCLRRRANGLQRNLCLALDGSRALRRVHDGVRRKRSLQRRAVRQRLHGNSDALRTKLRRYEQRPEQLRRLRHRLPGGADLHGWTMRLRRRTHGLQRPVRQHAAKRPALRRLRDAVRGRRSVRRWSVYGNGLPDSAKGLRRRLHEHEQ